MLQRLEEIRHRSTVQLRRERPIQSPHYQLVKGLLSFLDDDDCCPEQENATPAWRRSKANSDSLRFRCRPCRTGHNGRESAWHDLASLSVSASCRCFRVQAVEHRLEPADELSPAMRSSDRTARPNAHATLSHSSG